MKTKIAAALLATLATTSAVAGPSCNVPEKEWMPEDAFKAKVEAEGYKIKKFKVSRGNCYEIYGYDKEGNRVEIYFNPSTAEELERK